MINKQGADRWVTLSLAEQLGNIGSEVSRAGKWKGRDEHLFWSAVERGLALFRLTLTDPRWKNRRREIAVSYETFCDAALGGQEYGATFQNLQPYFDQFAIMARHAIDTDVLK